MVEALLNSKTTDLVISSEFFRKQEFKLKNIKKPIYVRNINSLFNKEGPIKYAVEVNKEYKEKMEINVIGE